MRLFDHDRLLRQDEGVTEWDMHADPGVRVRADRQLPTGTAVIGVVICHHGFGLGLRIDEYGQYGHVDVPEISAGGVAGRQDYQAIGAVTPATVIG
jgi:hypothetical protein